MTPHVKSVLADIAALIRDNPELADDAVLRADMIEGSTSLDAVVDALIEGAAADRAIAAARKSRANEIAAKANADEARADKKREWVAMLMNAAAIKKLVVTSGTVSLVAGKDRPKVSNVDELPQGFYTLVEMRKPDSAAIKAAVEAGESIPGVMIEPAKNHIQVR